MTRRKILSFVCALVWFSQAILHLLILFGAPLGKLFFGGTYEVFPLWLRPANLALFLVWATIGYAYLVYGGLVKSRWQASYAQWIVRLATVFIGLATVFNFFISTSPWEKYLTGSLTAFILLLSLWLISLPQRTHT